MEMEYRRLGKTGLKVSVLSFGSWVTFGPQLAGNLAEDCLAAAYDAGVNFFDNAEAYSAGESERIMGEAIASLGWPRHSYVLSTKLFWGIHGGVNMRNTLNRKYLRRPSTDRWSASASTSSTSSTATGPTPRRPVEETVWAMSDIDRPAARPSTGAPRSGRPSSCARPGTSPTATTSTSRWSSSPSTTCCGGTGWSRSTPPSTTASAWG
jgi:hypothetical protein